MYEGRNVARHTVVITCNDSGSVQEKVRGDNFIEFCYSDGQCERANRKIQYATPTSRQSISPNLF